MLFMNCMQRGAKDYKLLYSFKRKSQCLKVVELVGWSIGPTVVDFIAWVLEDAVSLEKVIVNPLITAWEQLMPLIMPDDYELEIIPSQKSTREHAMKLAAHNYLQRSRTCNTLDVNFYIGLAAIHWKLFFVWNLYRVKKFSLSLNHFDSGCA